MATYHHAYEIDRVAYLESLEPLEHLHNEERLLQLAKRGAETAARFDEHGFLVAIRQDQDWFDADIDELEIGPLLLVQMVPYLTPAHALPAHNVSRALAALSNEPRAGGMHDALRACVFGEPISKFFPETPWYEAVKFERFLDHYCGWLSSDKCGKLLGLFESEASTFQDILPGIRQLLAPIASQNTNPLVLALER
ncbi:hypothetical protein [Ruegeria sp.]|uniref:hypothetical protein n=1 Tax=Ruegeria sp. TaxID=1879320 RepID=UPI003C7D774E